ncbi:hypothetical protein DYY67_0858 [Candidatus Nitrosotalea sp. TS]|nr:hypothetical protein [Candidatus Nitrosotalea sp. TS]
MFKRYKMKKCSKCRGILFDIGKKFVCTRCGFEKVAKR